MMWDGELVDSCRTIQNSALRLPEAPDRGSLMHCRESQSKQDEPGSSQKAHIQHRSQRNSASNEDTRKPEGPRRLRWHVSYSKSKGRSPRQVFMKLNMAIEKRSLFSRGTFQFNMMRSNWIGTFELCKRDLLRCWMLARKFGRTIMPARDLQ